MDAAEVYSTLTSLAFVGGGLGWLAGVTRPARFAWLASRRRAYLWLAYATALPAYSALSNLPALHSSLASGGVAASPGMIAVLALGERGPLLPRRHSMTWLWLTPTIGRQTTSMSACASLLHPHACSWVGGHGSHPLPLLAGHGGRRV